jgi:hypothetical protein
MRRTIAAALLAFLLGVAVGPLLTGEQRTIILDSSGRGGDRLRALTAQGWVVRRSDRSDVGQLVTVERSWLPHLVGR